MQDVIHHSLESGRGVGETKIHHQGFKQTAVGTKSRFPFITLFDANVVKAPSDIQLSEVPRSRELVDQLINQRKWVTILHSDRVEHAIILHKAEFTILLLDKEDW